ncbi:MAG: TonB-dependent receptor, partial [Pseudomonadota bacterium]
DLNGDGNGDFASNGFELEQLGGRERRDAFIGTLQWQPNDIFSWEFDGYYSEFESDSFGRGIRVEQLDQIVLGSGVVIDNPVITDLDTLTGGTITRTGVAPIGGGLSSFPDFIQGDFTTFATVFNDDNSDTDELISIGSKFDVDLGRFRGAFDFTYSRADSFFRNGVTNISPIDPTIDGGGVAVLDADLVIDFQLNGTDIPDISLNQDFANLDTLALTRVGVFPTENEDELFAFAGDFGFDFEFGPITGLEFGARYSTREAEQIRTADQIGQFNGFFQFGPDGGFGEPLGGLPIPAEITEVGTFSGDFSGFQNFLIADVPALEALAFPNGIELNQDFGFTLTDSFIIEEDVIAGYFQFNVDTEISGLPVTGNFGLRIVNTDQSSSSTQFANGVALPIENGTSFTEYLPSANFIVRLTDRDLIRIGGSRAIARAPLLDLAANLSVNFNIPTDPVTGEPTVLVDNTAQGGGGNPLLEPFLANQGDISYEHYFDNGGIITLAAFVKSLESFVVDGSIPDFDFGANGADIPVGTTVTGQFNAPVNGEGGLVYGFETAYSQAFDFLPAPWDGFGAIINYSFTESEVEVPPLGAFPGNPETITLPGLSKHVLNPTIYYEKAGFSNRLSGRFRTDFISPQVGLDEQLPNTDSEFVLDYQASYAFPEESPLNGLTLLFQANNLTDEPVTTFFGDEEATGTIQFFGRQFFFGASY